MSEVEVEVEVEVIFITRFTIKSVLPTNQRGLLVTSPLVHQLPSYIYMDITIQINPDFHRSGNGTNKLIEGNIMYSWSDVFTLNGISKTYGIHAL